MNVLILDPQDDISKSILKNSNFKITIRQTLLNTIQTLFIDRFDLIIFDMRQDDFNESSFENIKKLFNEKLILFLVSKDFFFKHSELNKSAKNFCTLEEINMKISFKTSISLNKITKTVSFNGDQISLTSTESKILDLLLSRKNSLVSKLSIEEHVWGKNTFIVKNTVNTHLTNLKNKLKILNYKIVNIRGQGYILKD